MDNNTRATLIKILASGKEVPEEDKELIFPTINKEYEISLMEKWERRCVIRKRWGFFSSITNEKNIYNRQKWKLE